MTPINTFYQIISPRTHVQHFRNSLQYNAREEEEARDLLVDEHFITRGKADYCNVEDTAHYSYD